ncbi:branched-chain amino acid transport ATP-binding protein [Bradyrhizobiaceae bacterium SG-6C]|nr:branched-chain amino acid transport ATP-binding protein [Bradyrhizobiaceae bacterium SG-6C]
MLLEVSNISKTFGGVAALRDVNFGLDEGQLLALIGPNGAGKSTCFNVLNGQLAPDSGSVRLAGAELVGLNSRQIWSLGVGRTFQVAAVYGSMTVIENVQMALLSKGNGVLPIRHAAGKYFKKEALRLLERVGMQEQAGRPSSYLAYGDVKRLELAMALANDPKLLLMDEPTAGMAPKERHELMQLTSNLVRERNMSVLFTEHSMDVVFSYAHKLIVLSGGTVIAEGSAQSIRDNQAVQQAYFGSGKTFEAKADESDR